MTKDQAQRKMCPFMKRTPHNTEADIKCKTDGCMAWGVMHDLDEHDNMVEDPNGYYCKRLE